MFSPMTVALIATVALFVLLMLGMPIGFSLGIAGALGLMLLVGFKGSLDLMSITAYKTIANWAWIVIPLFILMGGFAAGAGVATDAYAVISKWVGKVPGAGAIATVIACGVFGACSASSVASVAALTPQVYPEMKRDGTDTRVALGSIAAGGTLASLIPPSNTMMIYGVITGVPIGQLFMAGYLPGILMVAIFSLGIMWMSWRRKTAGTAARQHFSWGDRVKSLKSMWGVLLLAITIMGGIFFGVTTATEAGALAAAIALIMLLIRGKKRKSTFISAVADSAATCSMVFMIILGASFYGYALTVSGLPVAAVKWVLGLGLAPYAILIVILLIYLPLGCILDTASMVLITMPIVFPIISGLGFNGVWFGILMTILVEIALITPPVGLNVFVLSGAVPEVPMMTIFGACVPFVLMQLTVLGLIIIFPSIALFLPNLMMAK